MGNTFFFQWEVELIQFLQLYMNDLEVKLMSIISMFGEELILILVLGFVYWGYDKKIGMSKVSRVPTPKNKKSEGVLEGIAKNKKVWVSVFGFPFSETGIFYGNSG